MRSFMITRLVMRLFSDSVMRLFVVSDSLLQSVLNTILLMESLGVDHFAAFGSLAGS